MNIEEGIRTHAERHKVVYTLAGITAGWFLACNAKYAYNSIQDRYRIDAAKKSGLVETADADLKTFDDKTKSIYQILINEGSTTVENITVIHDKGKMGDVVDKVYSTELRSKIGKTLQYKVIERDSAGAELNSIADSLYPLSKAERIKFIQNSGAKLGAAK